MVSTQHRYWAYILASQPRGTLYIGVTNNILGRVELHRAGKGSDSGVCRNRPKPVILGLVPRTQRAAHSGAW
jgi:predicted GIY-YIG superfamily endonuclease